MQYSPYTSALFTMHDKFERIPGLYDIHEKITDNVEFWALFTTIWTNNESCFLHLKKIREMLTPDRVNDIEARISLMDDAEVGFLKRSARRKVPIKVYRGGSALNLTGFSWTTRHDEAVKFAKLSGADRPVVSVGRVQVRDVLFYVMNRGESEVVAFPESVDVEKVEDVEPVSVEVRDRCRLQLLVQAKGPHAVANMTQGQWWKEKINIGLEKGPLIEHLTTSRAVLEKLGFKTRVAAIDDILAEIA